MESERTYDVAELSRAVTGSIEGAFPEELWVRGEIRDLNRSTAGHVYFDLVDVDAAGDEAVLPVVLFSGTKEVVNRYLMRTGAGRMTDGTEVRIRGFVGYYPRQARVQLRMTRIDAEYILGRLAAVRERLLRQLAEEGLLDRNRSLTFPLVPLRVGLVTSEGSAAAADFLHELTASGYAFSVVLADTRVQGAGAAASVARALRAVASRGVDVAALVRGGGSRSDLAAFDDETVARAVATLGVPVVTGIGHEIDETVVDRVAHRSFKTPTACAAGLVEAVAAYSAAVEAVWAGISRRGSLRLGAAAARLASAGRRLARTARAAFLVGSGAADHAERRLRRAVAAALEGNDRHLLGLRSAIGADAGRRCREGAARIERAAGAVVAAAPRALAAADRRVGAAAAQVRALDPERILARGWSVTRDAAGRLVRSIEGVEPGGPLETTVAGGVIRSRVESVRRAGQDGDAP